MWRYASGQFRSPKGVSAKKDGSVLYVSDTGNHRIQTFRIAEETAQLVFLFEWGSKGQGQGEFLFPTDIALGTCPARNARACRALGECPLISALPPGIVGIFMDYLCEENVYVVDNDNHRIQAFTDEGRFLYQWERCGEKDGEFINPSNLCQANATIYVCDRFNHRIQAFDMEGKFRGKWGRKGSGKGEFQRPSGITMDADGCLYVSDKENGRLVRFRPTTKGVDQWSSVKCYSTQLTFDSRGRLYLSPFEHQSSIRVYDVTTKGGRMQLTNIGLLGRGISYPNGLCVVGNSLFIAESFGDCIISIPLSAPV